jgi:hypothetical protein
MRQERIGPNHLKRRPPIFTALGPFNGRAKVLTGHLHAVADSQDRRAEVEDPRMGTMCAALVTARRPAAEDQTDDVVTFAKINECT